MPSPPPDRYFKKQIALRLRNGDTARFRVSQALFSSHEVDAGTRLLLRSLDSIQLSRAPAVLDLGCGYGPIAVALAMTQSDATVLAVDRDALAVDYTRQNAALNGIDRIEARTGLAYDDLVDERFDLIAMNIPGKAGDRVIEHLVLAPHSHLAPNGTVGIVAVAPLADLISATISGEPAIEISHQHHTASYAVIHYRFTTAPRTREPQNAFDAGIYDRALTTIDAGDHTIELLTVHGLSEFDTPSFATQLLLQELRATVGAPLAHIAVLNSNQGHAAVVAREFTGADHITIISRDLLSLRATSRNLTRNATPEASITLHHAIDFPPVVAPANLILATIDDGDVIDAAMESLLSARASLVRDGTMLIAASSTTATRIAKRLRTDGGIRIEERRRRRGSVILAAHRP